MSGAGLAARDRDAVLRRLVDRLRRVGAVEVRVRHVRRRGRGRPARRRRVAGQRRAAPAVRIRLDAAERRPREARALVDVAERRRARGRGVVLVVRRDVEAHVVRVDRRRKIRHRDLDLEVVAAGRAVAVVDGRRVAADPRRRRGDLDARGVRGVVDGRRERPGREALVVVGVALPARAVRAVAVGVRRVVREREDPELERGGRVEQLLRAVAARVDQDLDRVREPVTDALGRRHRVALEVVLHVDEEVEVVAEARDLGVRRARRRPACAGASPQSTPGGEQSRVEPPGSHLRPMSSASPVYSPAPSMPLTVGALAAAGIIVFGTMPSVRSSKPVPLAPNVVVMRTFTFVFCSARRRAGDRQRRVRERVRDGEVDRRVGAGRERPYGLDSRVGASCRPGA